MVDFEPPVSNRNRLAAWFAFYGEAKSRPTYMTACTDIDMLTYNATGEICRTIIEEGGYPNLEPERVVEGLSAMGDGLWLDLWVSPHNSDVEGSKATISTASSFSAAVGPASSRARDQFSWYSRDRNLRASRNSASLLRK